jgi:dienelactone hydrolase
MILSALFFLASAAQAAVHTETIAYTHEGVALEGFLAYDDAAKGPRPGVLVVHEWWGHGPYVRRRAEALAKLGYVAFAVDMYGKGVYAKDHEEAGKLSGAYRADRALMRGRALAGLEILKKTAQADPKRLAAIGYCFGGTTVLELARAGTDLAAVAAFHGGLDTPKPQETKGVKAKVLALVGAEDKWVASGLAAFQDEMRQAGADWQVVLYGGAVHSFTVKEAGNDPSKGMAYDENADRRSWQAMRDLFKETIDRK